MIPRFRKVDDDLYRGGRLSPDDVLLLKKKYNIKKIISLDEQCGKLIDRTCKLLKIEHIIIPINVAFKSSLINFVKKDLKKLFSGGPVFIGCSQGKDRTGVAVMIYRILFNDYSYKDALQEALSLGYGVGAPKATINLYNKLAKKISDSRSDTNSADIVSNERDRVGTGTSCYVPSWSPYAGTTTEYTGRYRDSHYDNGEALDEPNGLGGAGFSTVYNGTI